MTLPLVRCRPPLVDCGHSQPDRLTMRSDKTKAPTYYIKRIPDDPDTQLIVFTAGPPYEDIAFRIVRRPWEYSHRKGFRSNFDRGVLQREWREQRAKRW